MVFPPYFIGSIFIAIKIKTLKYEFTFLKSKSNQLLNKYTVMLSPPLYAINIKTI